MLYCRFLRTNKAGAATPSGHHAVAEAPLRHRDIDPNQAIQESGEFTDTTSIRSRRIANRLAHRIDGEQLIRPQTQRHRCHLLRNIGHDLRRIWQVPGKLEVSGGASHHLRQLPIPLKAGRDCLFLAGVASELQSAIDKQTRSWGIRCRQH